MKRLRVWMCKRFGHPHFESPFIEGDFKMCTRCGVFEQ